MSQDEKGFLLSMVRPPRFKRKDLVELKPGEHFSVTINIADAMCCLDWTSEDTKGQNFELANTAGEYEVKTHLILNDDTIPTDLRDIVWKGKKESNTITFTIDHGQNQASQEGQQVS